MTADERLTAAPAEIRRIPTAEIKLVPAGAAVVTRSQKILVGVGAGLVAVAASPFFPVLAIGGVALKLIVAFLGAFLGGWGTRTPGHGPIVPGEPAP